MTATEVARYDYDAFGALTQVAGVEAQPYGFTGREYDAESGLYYYRARTYDPQLSMFIQSDPIGFAGGDLNLYAYVGGNPYNFDDPSGNLGYAIKATNTIAIGGIASSDIGVAASNTGPPWATKSSTAFAMP